jgi:hypothetical protein
MSRVAVLGRLLFHLQSSVGDVRYAGGTVKRVSRGRRITCVIWQIMRYIIFAHLLVYSYCGHLSRRSVPCIPVGGGRYDIFCGDLFVLLFPIGSLFA